jgi:hypothetical protein
VSIDMHESPHKKTTFIGLLNLTRQPLFFFWVFLVVFVLVGISGVTVYLSRPGSASHSEVMIDLTKTGWYARQGFGEQDAAGFSPSDAGVRQVASFPILLNDIFQVPAGSELNHFTLMTRFE